MEQTRLRVQLAGTALAVLLVFFVEGINGIALWNVVPLAMALVDRNVESESAFGYHAEWLRHYVLALPSGESLRVGLDRVRFVQTMFDERG